MMGPRCALYCVFPGPARPGWLAYPTPLFPPSLVVRVAGIVGGAVGGVVLIAVVVAVVVSRKNKLSA